MSARNAIVSVALGMAIADWIWPSVVVTRETIWLVGIAAAAIVLPRIVDVIPYIFVRVGPFEIELRQDIARLRSEFDRAAMTLEGAKADDASIEVLGPADFLQRSAGDSRAALILLSTKIERAIRKRSRATQLGGWGRFTPLRRLLQLGIDEGVFVDTLNRLFDSFWAVRNRIVHGAQIDLSRNTELSLLDVAT